MSTKIRVMICDDSAVMRRILTTVLSGEADLDVAYAAQHGRDVLDNLDKVSPDIVVLDVEMPVMDGIQTVAAIRRKSPSLPIVMFSSLTSRGADATFDALSAGANDFATKPSGVGHLNMAVEIVKRELVEKIRGLAKARRRMAGIVGGRAIPRELPRRTRTNLAVPSVIAVGVSTGGPKVLHDILANLPGDLDVPIVVVQHMPSVFTGLLAERLNSVSKLQVREAEDGEALRPGCVWIARGDWHLEIVGSGFSHRLSLNQQPHENSVRPAVDPLFRSVARQFRDRVLGIVLTGMGKDGLEGSRAIRNAGGLIFAQDQSSSAVWGMPRQVVEADLADAVLPANQIAGEIVRRIRGKSPVVASTC